MAGITFEFGKRSFADQEAKKKRQEMAASLFDKMAEQGLQPDEINSTLKNFIDSGDFALPTMRTSRAEGPATQQGYLPSVQEPIKLQKKKGGLIAKDENGKWAFQPIEGVDSVHVAQDNSLVDVLDAQGNVVRQTRKGAVKLPNPAKDTSGRDPAQEDVAKQTLAKYYEALKGQEGAGDELTKAAASAAEFLGLPTQDIEKQAASSGVTLFGHTFGASPAVTVKAPSFGGGASDQETKVIHGVTYKKGADGKWHKQ